MTDQAAVLSTDMMSVEYFTGKGVGGLELVEFIIDHNSKLNSLN